MRRMLLENLAKRAGMAFLSDLHYEIYWPDIYCALLGMEANEYTLEEWEETVKYILGENEASFETPESAYFYLLQTLMDFTLP